MLAGAAALGAGLTEAGQLDDTLRMLDEVRRTVGPAYETEYHNLRGNAYLAMGRIDEALSDLTRAIELDPDNSSVIANRGETYRSIGRHDEALSDLTRAIELDPDNSSVIANRGETYRSIGRHDEALSDLTRHRT